jgi:hypothetical protein
MISDAPLGRREIHLHEKRVFLLSPILCFNRPQFLLKHVDLTVLSATFLCRFSLYASERAGPGYWHLAGSHVSKQRYQRLSYVVNVFVPVGCSFDKL